MRIMDLSGEWNYKTDYNNEGIIKEFFKDKFENEGFILPASACENGIGKKQEYYDTLTPKAVRAPREKFEYIAPLWLQKKITVPKEFDGKFLRLYLERVNIASELWIDQEKISRQIIELSAPHIYNLTGKLTAGEHILTLRIDNTNLINIDNMASGYSIDTQGIWNGIIGKIELQCEEIFHLENVEIYPSEKGIDIRLVETSDVYSPTIVKEAQLELAVTTPYGEELPSKRVNVEIYNSRQVEHIFYEISDIIFWDEFNPKLYTLEICYTCEGICDRKSFKFGMRTIKSQNKQILLNNKPISLRGTTDCAIFPITGYPPTDIDSWLKKLSIFKNYGLNYVRFHAWCPPEAAFLAADELGLYFSIEMPLWLNRDVCALEIGEDNRHREYFTSEAITISKTYGNHPSFIMFSCGNENMGDFELLEDIIMQVKGMDNRRLYTLTTNFDHPLLPCEDYLSAFEAGGHKVRMQDIQDTAAQSTYFDYSDAQNAVNVPIISFEIGQYSVYPDVDSINKYSGNMLPVNFDVIKKEMIKSGVYHKLKDYIRASGDLAVKLYKEEIEAALRTKGFGGFGLLSLCDYTGQNTATVGILDAFLSSKGLISPENFREFCSDIVPLFKAKRIFKNTEILRAEFDLYDYSENKILSPEFEIKIYNGSSVFYTAKTADSNISIPLKDIRKPSKLQVSLTVSGRTNYWNIYVFTSDNQLPKPTILNTKKEIEEIINKGGRAVVSYKCVKNSAGGSFIPVFWSPAFFPSKKPCGAIIDKTHPIFDLFPTDKYPDYQWKNLLDNSYAIDISSFGDSFNPIVETVPNFVDNTPRSPLFEVKVGKADLLYFGFDLEADDIATRQLEKSVYNYIISDNFRPKNIINKDAFLSFFK